MGRRSRVGGKGLQRAGPLSQPPLARLDDGLRAALDADLVEDAGDVVAHGLLGEAETGGYLRVVEPLRDVLQDLRLARREPAEALRAAEKALQLLEQPAERGLLLAQDVVVRLERHEARVGN